MTFLTRLSLSNRKIVAVLALGLIILGISVAPTLKQQLFPDLSLPSVTVIATYRGASPQVVEDQVTKPLEQAIDKLDGLDHLTSTSQQGVATLTAQFEYGAELADQQTAVRNAVTGVGSLPDTVTTQIAAGSTGDLPTMTLAAVSDGDQRALATALTDKVVPKIADVDGVNDVSVTGESVEQVVITPDTDQLKKDGLTTASISTAITAANGTSSAGALTSDGRSLSVSVGSALSSVSQIENLWLSGTTTSTSSSAPGTAAGGRPAGGASGATPAATTVTTSKQVQLKDVADVALKTAPQTSITRTDGRPSLGLSITMGQDGSAASISTAVRDQLSDLETALPGDAKLTVVSDNGPAVSRSVTGLLEEGLLGLLMAVLVILVFLRSIRSTMVTAISIPTSLLIAIIALWWQGESLNTFTLAGLTMAVGRVVDDSIVVLENIKRHLSYGKERRTAVLDGVKEVAGAVTSSTLTTVAVFVPITLVTGIVGELFGPFALTVTVAMIASLVVALTVVPVLAFWFLKAGTAPTGVDEALVRQEVEQREAKGFLQRVYRPILLWSLRFRKTVIAAALVLLIATVFVATGLKTNFLGGTGENTLNVSQTLPVGTDLATTNAAAKQVEAAIAKVNGVTTYQAVVGGSGGPFAGAGRSNAASYTVNLADDANVDTVQADLRTRIKSLSDVGIVTVGAGGFGGSSTVDVQVNATSSDALATATDRIEEAVKKVDSVTDVTTSLASDVPAIGVQVKGEAAAKAGITGSTLTATVAQAISGSIVSQVAIGGSSDDVIVRPDTDPTSVADIKALQVTTATGTQVRLDSVATVSETKNPAQLSRIDGQRAATVSATPIGNDTGSASTAVTAAVAGVTLPSGVTTALGGVTANQSSAFSQLGLAILAALALVVLILLTVFGSFRQTLILLVSVPFAMTGAVFLLRITDNPLGVAALIGILMLIGIVVTNAIVLMDRINQNRKRGESVIDSVVHGATRRLRPILMTALATMFALLPMALGLTGTGGIISGPLAVVVIGGLFTSTLLTLVLIPVLYTIVETHRDAKRAARRPGPRPDAAVVPTAHEPERTPITV